MKYKRKKTAQTAPPENFLCQTFKVCQTLKFFLTFKVFLSQFPICAKVFALRAKTILRKSQFPIAPKVFVPKNFFRRDPNFHSLNISIGL
jgi:hypothetical protein